MHTDAKSWHETSVAPHPLAELLQCPAAAGSLLNDAARLLNVDSGTAIFRQSESCQGLFLLVAGSYLRKTERNGVRLILGNARAGDLVELSAALGDGIHTYSLVAQTGGSALQLPISALRAAFQMYPPLRMQLLEELAREVSRGYENSRATLVNRARRRTVAMATPELCKHRRLSGL
jgi:CRP-like cAMP-binding protein